VARRKKELEDTSLIPLIQEAEAGLKKLLEQAQGQAGEELRAAECDASSALERAREEIPRRLELKRQEQVARFQSAAAPDLEGQDRLARRAEGNFARAVQAIVQAVWSGQ
jgi:hypothetical protein